MVSQINPANRLLCLGSDFGIQALLAGLALGRRPRVVTVQSLRHMVTEYGNTDRNKGKQQDDQACLESGGHGDSGVRLRVMRKETRLYFLLQQPCQLSAWLLITGFSREGP